MRVLVTGANGFVGKWMCEHLQSEGDEAIALDRSIDICDAQATRAHISTLDFDSVIHLAAWADVGSSWTNAEKVFTINATGTLSLLQAVAEYKPGARVLLVSSAEVYGHVKPNDIPITEDTSLQPVSPYAASKVAAEYLGVQAQLAGKLNVIRARPFNHIGPGQRPNFVVSAFAKRIVEAQREGRHEIGVGNLTPQRDFTDVRDVVRAYRLLLERGEPGEVYNICSGEAVSIEDVVKRFIAVSGVDVVTKQDPELVREVDLPVLRGDCTKLHRHTGWTPEITLDRSLSDVYDQWVKELSV